MNQEEVLQEILKNSRAIKTYMKWQLIITVALVVIPFVAVLVVLPMVLGSVTTIYGGGI